MSISPEGCATLAACCVELVRAFALQFRTQAHPDVLSGISYIDELPTRARFEITSALLADKVCRLGRLLRLVRAAPDKLGPGRKELLGVLTSFDLILQHYGWRDDLGGPGSMDDSEAWWASGPAKGTVIPFLPVMLFEGLERAGHRLLDTVSTHLPAGDGSVPPAPTLAHRVRRDQKQEARDKWIYERCCEGVPYKKIVTELQGCFRQNGWRSISSKQGVQDVARRYAERQGLDLPPPRQNL